LGYERVSAAMTKQAIITRKPSGTDIDENKEITNTEMPASRISKLASKNSVLDRV
jgi:hypothetical protein